MNYRDYSDSITLMEGAIADTNCILKATTFSLLFKFKRISFVCLSYFMLMLFFALIVL